MERKAEGRGAEGGMQLTLGSRNTVEVSLAVASLSGLIARCDQLIFICHRRRLNNCAQKYCSLRASSLPSHVFCSALEGKHVQGEMQTGTVADSSSTGGPAAALLLLLRAKREYWEHQLAVPMPLPTRFTHRPVARKYLVEEIIIKCLISRSN